MSSLHYLNRWLFIFVALSLQSSCYSISLDEELTLTMSQKLRLDEFKKEVAGRLPHDYMYEDIFLIKWLRYRDFNVQAATKMILNNVQWRKTNKIDQIMEEDFSFMDFDGKFPYWIDGRDIDGRPVGTCDISEWDVRPVSIARQGEKLLRYALKVLEIATRKIREDQRNGRNVTQFTVVANIKGFNFIQHSCLRCVSFYIKFLLEYEQNYPGILHKIFIINTPATFDVLYRLVYPLLNPKTTAGLEIYGTNKNQWQPAILQTIPADQIRPQFGGTKSNEIEDY